MKHGNSPFTLARLAIATFVLATAARAETIPLSALDLDHIQQGWGKPAVNASVEGQPLSIGGRKFAEGLGTHAASLLSIDLKKSATRFTASAGVDDDVAGQGGSVEFLVYGDGKILWRSGVMKAGDAAKPVDVPLAGVQNLILRVTDAGDGISYDHADWAGAQIEFDGAAPIAVPLGNSKRVILTPKPKPTPRLTGAKVFGVRPGSPFLFTITATGERPMKFTARDLPRGLSLDAETGRITGVLKEPGEHRVTLRAENSHGSAERDFKIVAGDQIQLTPPLGYNSWNCWGDRVSQEKMLRSARALVSSGLAQHGWMFINIDDGWQGSRTGPELALQPNEKFPDIKKLADEVHGMDLKIGIYSTPWMTSYANFQGGSSDNPEGQWDHKQALGKYSFAKADAQQWAQWDIDYLKYDWHPVSLKETKEMHDALRATGRDIVLSLSNNAHKTLHNEIEEISKIAELWRTTEDIFDNWESISKIGFSQDAWAKYQKPGHYNDPDMLVVGNVFGWKGEPHPSKLTPDEQYTHISLWSLLGAPLLIGCDLETLDDFTLGLLTNDEVIDIDQDPLCKQGVRVWNGGEEKDLDVYAKPLEDGSIAVGLFNRGLMPQPIPVTWETLGGKGAQVVRDVWRQQDIGEFQDKYETTVAPHGVALLKITPAKK